MNRLFGLVLLLVLTGCATTTTVLLPDEDGKVGALVLRHEGAEQVVDHVYTAATVGSVTDAIRVDSLSKEKVEKQYAQTLKAQPAPAVSFTLYFKEGGVELTEESAAKFPEIVATYNARAPAKVYVIGHTDTAGDADANFQLGLERARQVEQQLKAANATLDKIEVRSFGETDLAVPTADGVAEPRNRRVEILIL